MGPTMMEKKKKNPQGGESMGDADSGGDAIGDEWRQ